MRKICVYDFCAYFLTALSDGNQYNASSRCLLGDALFGRRLISVQITFLSAAFQRASAEHQSLTGFPFPYGKATYAALSDETEAEKQLSSS